MEQNTILLTYKTRRS